MFSLNFLLVFERLSTYFAIGTESQINRSAVSKEITVHYSLQPRHIFIRIKAFIIMPVPGGLQLLIISTCFAWRRVTSINKCSVLTAHTHVNCHINTQLFSLLIYTC